MSANNQISRRTFLTCAAAAASLPIKANAAPTDPHAEWFENWRAARKRWLKAASGHDEEWDLDAVAAAEKDESHWGHLISETVAKTTEGLAVQLEYWIEHFGSDYFDSDTAEFVTIKSVLEGMEALS